MEKVTDAQVAIIGAGPAGIGAAVQLARLGVPATVFEKNAVGGLVRNARRLDNLAGFPGGIAGPALAALLVGQLAASGAAVYSEEVVSLIRCAGIFAATTAGGEYGFAAAVVATGTRPRPWLDVVIAPAARERVFTEITALRAMRGQTFVVVGAGDAAFDYALTLAEYNAVKIVNRGAARRCLPALWAEAQATATIVYRENTRIVAADLAGDHLALGCETAEGLTTLAADYLVLAIGREADTGFLGPEDDFKDAAEAGLFHLVGDVANGRWRQASIAYGEGIKAAMIVAERLRT